jgi:hypothetical protein
MGLMLLFYITLFISAVSVAGLGEGAEGGFSCRRVCSDSTVRTTMEVERKKVHFSDPGVIGPRAAKEDQRQAFTVLRNLVQDSGDCFERRTLKKVYNMWSKCIDHLFKTLEDLGLGDLAPNLLGSRLKYVFPDDEKSMLSLAVQEDCTGVGESLIQAGLDVNHQDKFEWTPLIMASSAGRLEMVEMLLRNGADPKLCDRSDQSSISVAARNGRLSIIKKLVEHGGVIDCDDIGYAGVGGDTDTIKYFIEQKAKKNPGILKHGIDSAVQTVLNEGAMYRWAAYDD